MPIDDAVKGLIDAKDGYKKVKIGSIELGERRDDAPDTSKPNPTSIEWTQEFVIAEKAVVGEKPVTILTVPETIWKCTMEFSTLDNRPEVLQPVIELNGGPYWVEDYLLQKCMLLKKKGIKRKKGTKDWYNVVVLEFWENNPGVY